MVDSLATENVPTGDNVWSSPRVIRLVANVAARIRMDYKHLRARVEDPYTGGGKKKSSACSEDRVRKKTG